MNVLLMTSAAPAHAPFSTSEKRPPLGVGFLIAVLKRRGHRVHFSDEYLRPSSILSSGFLQQQRIDAVGLYANTICYQKTLGALHTLDALRRRGLWRGKILVGGPHTAVALDTIPDFVDHVVLGEGELCVPQLVEGARTERVVVGQKVKDMDALPRPAWEEFVWRPYDWGHPWVSGRPVFTLNTSRGCPFACSFCSVQAVWGRSYRYMSAERILDDVEYMQKAYGMQVAYFREDHFTLNKKRTVAFCEGLLQRDLGLQWMCETRADDLDDPQYVELMARAGCRALYIGVESGSPRMLSFFNKGETTELFQKAFHNTRQFGIKTYASFVVGAPNETREDVQKTLEFIRLIQPDYYNLNVYVGLPGSDLYDYVRTHQLYEYEDENRVLYLKGHDRRVDEFAGGNPLRKVPRPERVRKWKRRETLARWAERAGAACSAVAERLRSC
ncbi:MAG: radical SAM protein [Deferrisomatales bacterium]